MSFFRKRLPGETLPGEKGKSGAPVVVIAGLGNPGSKYEHTRHNVGFDAIDVIAEKYGIEVIFQKFHAVYGMGRIGDVKVLLMKPLTFMNASGNAIAPMLQFYKIDPAKGLIVISDDVNLAAGQLRIRAKGSAGGHNGLKDIIDKCGTEGFARIRIGVGENTGDMVRHVLGRMDGADSKRVAEAYEEAAEAVALMVQGRIEEAMNQYNRKK